MKFVSQGHLGLPASLPADLQRGQLERQLHVVRSMTVDAIQPLVRALASFCARDSGAGA